MIQANELRTTNIVYTCKGGIETRVGQIFAGMQNEFQPIPLTEEWLLKFGFEKVVFDSEETGFSFEYHLTYKGANGFIIEYMDDFSCCILGAKTDIGLAPNLNECKYVHKLQNLYFALTGEELEYDTK